jgi:O-succinylbenzoate synthase
VSDGLAELLDRCVPYALPLTVPFRGLAVREGVLVDGPSGWGEFAPFDDYSDEAAARWLDAAVEAAFGSWPTPMRTSVEVNAIVPALDPVEAAALAVSSVRELGCRTVKIKVGDDGDVSRVEAVRAAVDAVAPGCQLRLDANGAWGPEEAIARLRLLEPFGLEYVEQPCRTAEETLAVRRAVDVPIAVDELVRQAGDPAGVRVAEFADLAIVKVGPIGGVRRALAVAAAVGVPVVVSGALDSAVGLAAGVALAAALPPRASGLGTGALLAADVVRQPWRPLGGSLPVGRVSPEPEALEAAAGRVSPERQRAWRERVERAWRAGTETRLGALVRAGA